MFEDIKHMQAIVINVHGTLSIQNPHIARNTSDICGRSFYSGNLIHSVNNDLI